MRRIATLSMLVLFAAAAAPTAASASSAPAVPTSSLAPDSAPTIAPAHAVRLATVADSIAIVAQRAPAIDAVATLAVHASIDSVPSPALAAAVDTLEHTASLRRSTLTRSRSMSVTRRRPRARYGVAAAIHSRLRPRALVRT